MYRSFDIQLDRLNRLDLHNVYNKSIIIDTSQDTIELPTIGLYYIHNNIKECFMSDEMSDIILPLYRNGAEYTKKTFDSIIKEFFYHTNSSNRLSKCNDGKGGIYYGGPGLILDKDYNPLLMCTVVAEKINKNDTTCLQYIKGICRINPRVFQEKDVVTRGIISKLIPAYSDKNNRTCMLSEYYSTPFNNIQIIIDDFDQFFVSPIKPSGKNIQEQLNQCLVDNLDDILDNI
jgi:hypothetical protein